ncbi:DUF397 domain-containing protein [Actinokineospora auranticolor]|uniref:DUF397 domain-containing protein n=1 Tax=Actinokineospora auranticolor TaxID=155976 RepID=UPI001FE42858|nr:DUF397 domain-containing protein [Actinokineospora auranticolor]
MSGTEWRISSYSGTNANACVELSVTPGVARVRDSKFRAAGELTFSPSSFAALLEVAKRATVR